MTDLVNVDSRRGSLVVSSYSTTTAGFRVMNGWFVSLDDDVTDGDLGEAVLEALAHCRGGVPVPPRDSNPLRPLLDGVGVRNWAEYATDAKAVSVRSGDNLQVVPTENRGSRDGFVEIPDKTLRIPPPVTAAELGKAVRDVLAHAR
jgi:hypothetical protein